MRKLGYLKQLYYCHFAQPASDRVLFRNVVQNETQSILEVGIASLARTQRILQIAHRFQPEPAKYWGIDLFEADEKSQKKVGLKMAHVELKRTGAKVKLIPGDPYSCLYRTANLIEDVDLLVIGSNIDDVDLERSWFYLHRCLHPDSSILREQITDGKPKFNRLEYRDVEALAEKSFGAYSVATKRAA